MEIQAEFLRRLLNEWLPAYCDDPKRNYLKEGFDHDSINVTSQDARDFMRAIDNKLVADDGHGRYRMPRSKTDQMIFWEHEKAISPRPITLSCEPVISIAAIARLHLDYGWPLDCLGMESEKGEFDLTAFKPPDFGNEYIAGEVKKSSKELASFLANLHKSCAESDLDYNSASRVRINAHKKWLGLRRCKAPLFWALGPSGESHVFDASYSPEGAITLKKTTDERLSFPNRP